MNRTWQYISRTTARPLFWEAFVLVIAVFVASTSLYQSNSSKGFVSPEVDFSDPTGNGMVIVPASCPSAPPSATGDGGGYIIYSGTVGAEIDTDGYDFCLTNGNGSAFFLPVHTAGELQTFLNNIGAVPGASYTGPNAYPWYCWYGYGGAYNYAGGC